MVTGARGWIAGGVIVVVAAFVVGLMTRPSREIDPVRVDHGLAARPRAAAPPDVARTPRRGAAAPLSATAAAAPELDAHTRIRGHGVPVPEVFDAEARDVPWATAVEASATASYLRVLSVVAPWATTVSVDCRTSLCKVSLDVDQAQVQASMNRLQSVSIGAGISPFAEQGDDGHWRAGVYVLFDRNEREPATLPHYWTGGVDARFPGGNAQLETWLAESERRAREEEQQRAAGRGP